MPLILYADDICLIADSAADLQRMLSVSQKFADESSFQFSMEKSQVVVFGPDAGDRFADEFRLMGTLMDVVSEYTETGRHQRSFSPEIRNDLTRDARHDERGSPGFVDGR